MKPRADFTPPHPRFCFGLGLFRGDIICPTALMAVASVFLVNGTTRLAALRTLFSPGFIGIEGTREAPQFSLHFRNHAWPRS
jgi:hypothetical protein